MADDLYALSLEQIQRVAAMLSAFEAGELGRPQQPGRQPLGEGPKTIFGTLDGAAAATTALTGGLKSATLSVYSFTTTGGTTDTGHNETVWNAAKMQADTGRWTIAQRISANQRYVITYQAASTTGCT